MPQSNKTPIEFIKYMCKELGIEYVDEYRKNNKRYIKIKKTKDNKITLEDVELSKLKAWYKKGSCERKKQIPSWKISVEEIQMMCKKLGFIYIDSYSSNGYTNVQYICQTHYYKGKQTTTVYNIKRWYLNNSNCMCAHSNRDTEDLKRDPNLNTRVKIIGEYKKSNQKIECECKECSNRWKTTPNKLQQGEGCPICASKDVRNKLMISNEEFVEKLKNKQPNLDLIGDYNGAKNKCKYRCKLCGYEGEAIASSLLSLNTGCRRCKCTIGERKVGYWLDTHDYKYKTEFIFPECKDIAPLRFDFYIPSINTCIEYQGEQHYKPIVFQKDEAENVDIDFAKLKERDKIKREFCANNNIALIEVPYWEINNIDNYLNKLIC